MTTEQKARVSMDALLVAAGRRVCNVSDANIHAAIGVATREFEAGVDANCQRAQALRQSTLAKAFSS